MISSSRYRTNRNLVCAWLATTTLSIAAFGGAMPASAQEAASYDIPAGPLSTALNQFARQAKVELIYDAPLTQYATSPGLKGSYDTADALSLLLAESGVTFRQTSARVFTLARAQQAAVDGGAVTLGPLQVEGERTARENETGAERDARRKDEVYDQDISSAFASREEIERYRGTNTADVLKGMVNVFSGDARNGGAIDPSIRGTQGPGRVPVIIDGTEQALTVWRGYNGASNRSYIDPSLISGLQVLKGPVSTRGVNGSTGGAVVVNTLDAADILKPGQTFGIEMKLEGGNNSTNPRLPTLLTGQDYTTVPGFLCSASGSPTYPYCDASLRVNLRTADDNESFSAGDRAIRIAAAGRVGDFELFGAYAFRERGNYFSGKNSASYYQQEGLPQNSDTYVRILGLHYEPGNEVPNTSSELESVLLKATWHIDDDQALQVGFRDTRSKFGEIMPSRIMTTDGTNFGNVQWPLSKVHAQAYNAEYKWQPDSRWIDLKATAWLTDTVSNTYSAGGFPNSASTGDPIIIDSALMKARNDRFGFSASNQFNLSSKLNLLLDANWQHEKLRSDDEYTPVVANGFRQYPRAGRREEYRINLSGEWKPVKFLKLNAGLAYSGYWAKDDFLPKLIEYNNGSISQLVTTSYATSYQTTETGVEAYTEYRRAQLFAAWANQGVSDELVNTIVSRQLARDVAAYEANPVPFTITNTGTWEPDASGNYSRASNVCLNGSLATLSNYVAGSCYANPVRGNVSLTEAKRKSGHGWAPSASATLYLSDSSRAYVRYAQALRFPSMFESTIGFSASINPTADLKPERIKSWEAAFIQDLRPLFRLNGPDQRADVKLTWYQNTTHDLIERDTNLMFSNLDKQVIAGFELQVRFDNGHFFTDISAGHMTKNQACDESLATTMDEDFGRVPNCVKYGFVAGFLLTQATPEDTVNWSVGGRFFDKRLELGGRLIWYSGYDNPQLAQFTDLNQEGGCVGACALNIPYTWGEIITFDAYARFRINERFTAELSGTNLNDRYYMDPLSRSMLPAPGRTVRMSLTGRF
ncbi:MAG: TonB-dependent receptor [Sphingobium sp.]|uniref:TonB-dependent receptor n=1 Tax=Sphingobium sp. TaxID=1912891 RepID=UPI0029AE6263|nr:TonB-dependent receptor [Sphingobium sp.]MDX3911279.1 TonB-dependent receptor [Sphingobium sp.]